MISLHTKVTLSLIITFFAVSCQSTAQETTLSNNRTWYGIFGNAGWNLHSAFFTGFKGTARCGTFTDGSGFGYSGGIFVQFPLGPQLALVTRLGFSSMAGNLEAFDSFQSALPPDYSQVVDVTSRHTLETRLPLVLLDFNARIEPLPIPLAFSFGPAMGMYLDRSFSQNEEIVSPPNLTFGTNKNVTGTLPGSSSFVINLTGGIEYDIPLSANLMLTPEIRASVPLTTVAPDMDWRIYTIRGGIQLKLAAPQPEQPIPAIIPPTPQKPLPTPPAPPQLDIALKVKGIDAQGRESDLVEIVVEETESSDLFPLLPYVFFAEQSRLLPASLHLLRNSETPSFKIENLPPRTMEIYSELLNIIGKRLQRYPQARITLTGSIGYTAPEQAHPELAALRAEEVREYLVKTWRIDPNRITVTTAPVTIDTTSFDRPDLEQEARRVVISSDEFEILKPITIQDIKRAINPPAVKFIPLIQSQAAVAEWTLIAGQGTKTLVARQGQGKVPTDFFWKMDEKNLPKTEQPLHVSLIVSDNANQTRQASASIPVRQLTLKKKAKIQKGNMRIDQYRLLLFDFDRADLSPMNQRILDMVRASITPFSRVIVKGYTDRVGNWEYNKRLSLERAENVWRVLFGMEPGENNDIKGFGQTELYNNDLPEGRFFCRTVFIVVQTPAN